MVTILENLKSGLVSLFSHGNHPFSTSAKFSEKITFLTPDTHARFSDVFKGYRNVVVSVSRGKKC